MRWVTCKKDNAANHAAKSYGSHCLSMNQSFLGVTSSPLIPLHVVNSDEMPLICVPGAGAGITAFVDFIGAVGERWSVYGLQPRGMDLAEPPHESVEETALYNLRALTEFQATQGVHLLGHSHGGLVVFEMALRLREQQRHVASVTLIDTEPPGPLGKRSDGRDAPGIFREFIEAIEENFDKALNVDDAAIGSGDEQTFICALHAALVKYHLFSARSVPTVLRGPLAVFIAARRSVYLPNRRYPGRVHLVLVSGYRLNGGCEHHDRARYAREWEAQVAELNVWYGPGNHSSILQFPHAKTLAEWWIEARKADLRRQG